jgi:hypothetical protein
MFRGPGADPGAGAGADPEAPGLDIKSNENTIESSFTVFNSNPGRFPLFRSNSL